MLVLADSWRVRLVLGVGVGIGAVNWTGEFEGICIGERKGEQGNRGIEHRLFLGKK